MYYGINQKQTKYSEPSPYMNPILPAIPANCDYISVSHRSLKVTNLEMRVYGLTAAANQRVAILTTRRIPRDSAEELIPRG